MIPHDDTGKFAPLNERYILNPTTKTGRSIARKGETGPPPTEPASPAALLFQGQRHPKNRKKYRKLEQWIEVRIVDGKTVTRLYPPNEKLILEGQAKLPPPEMVIRRINFPDGIPPEYEFLGVRDEEHRRNGGLALQRMTVNMWLEAIEKEKQAGTGHLGPVFNLPDFTEQCECAACRDTRSLLLTLAMEARAANRPTDFDSLLTFAKEKDSLIKPAK